eukprot:3036774-Lingulodinium_polyedra.AAC.1
MGGTAGRNAGTGNVPHHPSVADGTNVVRPIGVLANPEATQAAAQEIVLHTFNDLAEELRFL